MSERVERSGLKVDGQLAAFLEQRVLAPIGQDAAAFWQGFAALCDRLVPQNRALLAKRDALQTQIDAWHLARKGQPIDADAYRAFLTEIGYLVPEPEDFLIGTQNVDEEIATMAGPQLVVPVLNARFLLNAANARWGSLYDAFYGTDALDAPPARPGGYDARRGGDRCRAPVPHGALPGWEAALTGGECPHPYATRDGGVMFKHNGLHIEW
jgi:malate synthase